MPAIIHMEFKKRRPERFLIYWDTGEETVFSPEIVLKYQFSIGKEFGEREYRKVVREDQIRRAKDQLLNYLTRRPHSRKELLQKALKKDFEAEAIEAAMDDLEKVQLISDESFTKMFIDNELRFRPCGRLLLREKLKQKGIDSEIYEAALDLAYKKTSADTFAERVAIKFLRRKLPDDTNKRKERLIRHLQSRGFSWDQINHVLHDEDLMNGEKSEYDDPVD
jgi:regulatory protein